MTKTEADKKIDELVTAAKAAIKAAEDLATEHETGFMWDLAYGMGGWFNGIEPKHSATSYADEYGWQASSESC